MIRSISRRYFEIWGNEEAQNVFLKGLLTVLSVLFLIQSISLTVLALRKPVLVAVGRDETQIFNVTPPNQELLASELKRVVQKYAEAHYNWDFTSITKAHTEAARYVSDKFVKSFLSANAEQVKFAQDKKISERVYLTAPIEVDTKLLIARVQFERVFSVDGIRAVNPFVLDITFEYGPRTDKNPEGIYITEEKIVNLSQNGG